MEKNKPVNLGLDDLIHNTDIITNEKFRIINCDIGMVISFACMKSILFRSGQPYRTKEGRIIRVLQGRGRISINLIEYTVEKGMIIISPAGSLIELLEISSDYDFQVIVPGTNFLPVMQGNFLSDSYMKNGILLNLNTEEWEYTGTFYSLLWDTMHKTPFQREVVQHLVAALLYYIRYTYQQKQIISPHHLSRQEDIFRRFITLVNEHGKHEHTVGFYADRLFLTPRYLSTVIREVSGQTVIQWINQAIILEAKVLLKHSDMLIFQISDELNFPNPSFFSKFFKRNTGMTPVEYQKG